METQPIIPESQPVAATPSLKRVRDNVSFATETAKKSRTLLESLKQRLTPEELPQAMEATGMLNSLPNELLYAIMGMLKARELTALRTTCKYFYKTSLTDEMVTEQLDAIPRAKRITPHTSSGENWHMLLAYFQAQSAAAAQATGLALGSSHSIGLLVEEDLLDPEDKRSGEIGLYTWGRGFYGQLGTGDYDMHTAPIRIHLPPAATDPSSRALPAVVASGSNHSCTLSRKGDLFSWGLASSGELGHPSFHPPDCPIPRQVRGFHRLRIVSISAGAHHSLCIDENGSLWTCGRGRRGELGTGSFIEEAPMTRVADLERLRVVCAVAGAHHSLALVADGTLFSWGDGRYGQLGHAALETFGAQPEQLKLPRPFRVDELNPRDRDGTDRVTAIASGAHHSLILTVGGEVMAFGRNQAGQLGLGHTTNVWAPTRVTMQAPEEAARSREAAERMLAMGAGVGDKEEGVKVEGEEEEAKHVEPLVKTSNHTYNNAAPSNTRRQPSLSAFGVTSSLAQPPSPPLPVTSTAPLRRYHFDCFRTVQIAAGGNHTTALVLRNGVREVYTTGSNAHGQLGVGAHVKHAASFQRVEALCGTQVVCVVAGEDHNAAVGPEGELFMWGRGDAGQLGMAEERSHLVPTRLPKFRLVMPERTLRRRGAKGYFPLPRQQVQLERQMGVGGASAPTSPSKPVPWGHQPGADWILRAWQRNE